MLSVHTDKKGQFSLFGVFQKKIDLTFIKIIMPQSIKTEFKGAVSHYFSQTSKHKNMSLHQSRPKNKGVALLSITIQV